MSRTMNTMVAAMALLATTAGCGSDGMSNGTLGLTFSGLSSLGDGFVYEGWLIVDGTPVTAGRFDIDGQGMAKPSSFELDSDTLAMATMYVLTIEPAVGDDPAPSDTHVLAGAFQGSTAALSIGHDAALASDFSMAAGSYILNTPSSGSTDDDYDQGIWFLQMVDGSPQESLTLPDLPKGWSYEGWVAGPSGTVSTGRFQMGSGEDKDGAGPDAGPDGFPPFPGQDYVDPAMLLIDLVAVISVEPEPDDSPAPFALKPLIDDKIEGAGIGVTQTMANKSADNPSGSAAR